MFRTLKWHHQEIQFVRKFNPITVDDGRCNDAVDKLPTNSGKKMVSVCFEINKYDI